MIEVKYGFFNKFSTFKAYWIFVAAHEVLPDGFATVKYVDLP